MRRTRSVCCLRAQGELDLWSNDAPLHGETTSQEPEDPTARLMERAVSPSVISEAISRVISNKGAAGVDGIPFTALRELWKTHGERICEVLLDGSYSPCPVRRVTIPKPDGGERELGIPTVQDRVVQQMLLLVLQPIFDPQFSEGSYGFRPGRSAHDAVRAAKGFVEEGRPWVADIDLEKFFDRVHHDLLMNRLSKRIADQRVLKVIRRFLRSGIMDGGILSTREEGTPQGGPLSPFLANFLLDDLDKELERRGHRFVRYADDCNVYFETKRAAERGMAWITEYMEVKLRLKVNRAKSAVALSSERRFPGFHDLP
jgi:RNA-directed DNA polymerase